MSAGGHFRIQIGVEMQKSELKKMYIISTLFGITAAITLTESNVGLGVVAFALLGGVMF